MTTDMISPLGAVWELRHGPFRATVREIGAVLETFDYDGTPIIDGPYPATELQDVFKGSRGNVLMPWPNRVAGGTYQFDGSSLQLSISEASNGNAIHGFARWATWTPTEQSSNAITLVTLMHAHQGYPFVIEASVRYELNDEGIKVSMSGVNRGEHAAPFGMGTHPYVRTGSDTIDRDRFTSAATQYYEVDEKQIPQGSPQHVAGTGWDFTTQRALEGAVLDTCFTGLQRAEDGVARFEVAGDQHTVTVWMDEAFSYAMIFTGDTLKPEQQRRSIAIEPMTCAPDAFNNGAGLVTLQPGDRLDGSWGISVA